MLTGNFVPALSLLLAAVAALTIAGCGGQSGEPVKIGVLFDDTGGLSDFGANMRRAPDLSIGLVNEAGGVLGRPLEAVHRDGATDP